MYFFGRIGGLIFLGDTLYLCVCVESMYFKDILTQAEQRLKNQLLPSVYLLLFKYHNSIIKNISPSSWIQEKALLQKTDQCDSVCEYPLFLDFLVL